MNQQHLKWRCRRGVLELDVIFERFWQQYTLPLTDELANALAALLQEEDPALLAWLVYRETPPTKHLMIVETLLSPF